MSKFYTIDQNNSGGYFIEDDKLGICSTVILEASSSDHAKQIFQSLADKKESMFDYCSCCGERWSPEYLDEDDGYLVPTIYGKSIYECKAGLFRTHAYVHYLDGSIKRFDFVS